ncbi:MAG: MFS transporter [Gemmatimonadota bacterium]
MAGITRAVLRSLKYRNFRLFTIGQSISVIGSWVQQVAVGWLVYRLTDSALMLGLVSFAAQGPTFVLAPLAGAIADRANKHRLLIITQTLMMVQALVLAALVLSGTIVIWHLVLLSVALGCLSGFDIPVRQSFLVEMVDGKEDLSNAIALNSSMFNAARLVGPAIAGILITVVGEGVCILLNGLSYSAVLWALLAMRIQRRSVTGEKTPVFAQIREGFTYAFSFPPIRAVLLLVAVVSLLCVPFSVLLPIYAGRILGGDARVLGLLISATGAGALAAALYLASRESVRGLSKVITFSALLFALALLLFSFSRVLWLSMLALVLAGFGMMLQMAASNTFLQTIVDDDKRGRILALYTMAYIGTAPVGSLLMGWVAQRLGAPATIAGGAAISLIAAAAFGRKLPDFRAQVRPIYRQLGIIPEVATGIQAATTHTTEEPS